MRDTGSTRGTGSVREAETARGGVQSIDRAVAVLACFSPARPHLPLVEVARTTGLSRSTAHRLLAALSAHGLVQQAQDSTVYSLGPRLLDLADTARPHVTPLTQASPVMTWLRDASGETVGLHVLDEDGPARRTLAQVESTQALRRTYTDLGSARPAHQGAPGKVLLAHARPAVQEAALAGPLEAADGTGLDAPTLRAELEQIRADGLALSLEERVPGVVALAVPVRDHTGTVTCALSISIPAVRAGREQLLALRPTALDAAAVLSARLGHVPTTTPSPDPTSTPSPDPVRTTTRQEPS